MSTLPWITTAITATGWTASASYAVHLFRRVHTDRLTGLANRDALRIVHRRTARRRGLVGVLLIDLDHFKAINDRHGHAVGNTVLTHVAARLHQATRRGELAVRLHGDEFALWLGRITDPAVAERRAREVAVAVSEPLLIAGHCLRITASVGAVADSTRTDLSALLGAADTRMYAAKQANKVTTLPTPRRAA